MIPESSGADHSDLSPKHAQPCGIRRTLDKDSRKEEASRKIPKCDCTKQVRTEVYMSAKRSAHRQASSEEDSTMESSE